MGPPYDSATFKYLRFDCDITKGALWRFSEAAHLLISQCSVMRPQARNNQLRMQNNQFVAWHQCVHFVTESIGIFAVCFPVPAREQPAWALSIILFSRRKMLVGWGHGKMKRQNRCLVGADVSRHRDSGIFVSTGWTSKPPTWRRLFYRC
jgi:hypothetical protein